MLFRSYRRALAPVMLFAGICGMVAMVAGIKFHFNSPLEFGVLWLGTAIIVISAAFFIARRQAFKSQEKFWTSPTRRVGQALLPPLMCGMIIGVAILFESDLAEYVPWLPSLWTVFYGLALHSASFFMPPGIRRFGWVFISTGCILFCAFLIKPPEYESDFIVRDHLLMGGIFGGLHLAYGIYLYFTEKRGNES